MVTVVDEAHLLKKETLEEIRFMLNCRMDSMNPMALSLWGRMSSGISWSSRHMLPSGRESISNVHCRHSVYLIASNISRHI